MSADSSVSMGDPVEESDFRESDLPLEHRIAHVEESTFDALELEERERIEAIAELFRGLIQEDEFHEGCAPAYLLHDAKEEIEELHMAALNHEQDLKEATTTGYRQACEEILEKLVALKDELRFDAKAFQAIERARRGVSRLSSRGAKEERS